MSLDDVELHLVDDIESVTALGNWLGERRPVNALGIDTETGGFDRIKDALRLVQVGDGQQGWAIPWERWGGLIEAIIARWDGDWILHNAPFDLAFLDREGVKLPRSRIHDTMVQSRINESHMSMALKSQASRHIDSAAAGLQADLAGTKWTWDNVPITYGPYWQYGALDPVLTYRLHEFHYPTVMSNAPAAYDLEMAVLWVVQNMERYGTHVDRETASRRLTQFTDHCEQIEKWTLSEYNVKAGSNASIIEILEGHGYAFSKPTKSGAKALDAEVLGGIDHPLAQAVLARRQAQKMASTYLRFYVERSDENDLIHPNFNTLGARTSRMSCSDPNLQNLPRLGTSRFGDVVRNCFTSRYVDQSYINKLNDANTAYTVADAVQHGSLIMSDFDQIEMRMLAHFAQEQGMIDAFKSDGDFFVNLARQIFQDDTIVKKDPRRQITKNAGYAKIYSAGIQKFALTAGVSVAQARDFLARFDALYPRVRAFQNEVLATAMQRQNEVGIAYARSPLTGRRHVADRRKEYALINYLVQGAAAEVNKMKLLELDAAGLGDFMFATVHDEVLLDVPGDRVLDTVDTLNKIMNDSTMLSVPITAGVSFGAQWGRKRDWEPAA
jgi:DNA polymerase-1